MMLSSTSFPGSPMDMLSCPTAFGREVEYSDMSRYGPTLSGFPSGTGAGY